MPQGEAEQSIAGLCPRCAGSGSDPDHHDRIACWKCNGTGAVVLRGTKPTELLPEDGAWLAELDRIGEVAKMRRLLAFAILAALLTSGCGCHMEGFTRVCYGGAR